MNDDREKTIFKIQDEHRSISAILSGLRELARTAQDEKVRPEFAVLHAMVHYIDAYPERLHHPNEERYLFKPLLARAPSTSSVVGELQSQHLRGERFVRELERSLIAFEVEWPRGAARFAAAVNDYSDFHWAHMRKEEQELLPLAERYFIAEDWQAAAAGFCREEDPLAGVNGKDFTALFSRIVNLAPAPVGLGTPWTRTTG